MGCAGLSQLEGQKLRDHAGPAVSRFHQVFEVFGETLKKLPQQSRHVSGRQMVWRWLGASRCLTEDIGTGEDARYRKRGKGAPRGIEGSGWGPGWGT